MPGDQERVVDCYPEFNTIPKCLKAEFSVLVKYVNHSLAGPASVLFLQCEGQVPVVEGDNGSNVPLDQGVNECIVVLEALDVDRFYFSIWKQAGPRDGEEIRGDTQEFKGLQVLLQEGVAAAGDIRGGVVESGKLVVSEEIPDRGSFPILLPTSLNLKRRAPHAP